MIDSEKKFLGFFDSGVGGVQTRLMFASMFPDYNYCCLSDTAYAPYGTQSPQVIRERTFLCLRWLFDHGACLVIIACNTAAAYAIKDWQTLYPDKKVLSVTIPAIECMREHDDRLIAIFATQMTVESGIYPHLFERF